MVDLVLVLSNPPKSFERVIGPAQGDLVSQYETEITKDPYQPQRRLTLDERKELVSRYEDGEHAYQLAAAFQIHRSTVASILVDEGVRRPRLMTEDERAEAIKHYADGLTCRQIAAELGRSFDSVRRALHAAGVQLRDPRRGYDRTRERFGAS